tara:strand:- start:11612 stop:11812 length:201 start_codon:yes stop_codon:yes gene_type:complete
MFEVCKRLKLESKPGDKKPIIIAIHSTILIIPKLLHTPNLINPLKMFFKHTIIYAFAHFHTPNNKE